MIATVIVFFFKHKTAYYMRISDWSSDVCSSDLSREAMGDGMPFDAAAAWGERVLKRLIGAPWSPRTLVNINFPALPADEVKGVKVVDQGLRDYGRLRIIKGTDPRGYDYYWFGLGEAVSTPGHHTDLEAVQDGFVSVTPLHLDMTHPASLELLRERHRSSVRLRKANHLPLPLRPQTPNSAG